MVRVPRPVAEEVAAMLPQRPPASTYLAPAARKSDPAPGALFEAVKLRVLARLEERLDMGSSKRMPQSLLRQSLRQHAEQAADLEARGFGKPDRDRLVDEVLRELFGYGPLEELFADAAVREVMVIGPAAVIARRDLGQWLPTSVTFRDEAHLRATLDRVATHAEPVGPVMASMTLFDVRLPNGFRAVALIPPDALERPAMVSFIRESTVPVPAAAPPSSSPSFPGLPAGGSASAGSMKAGPASSAGLPRPGTITASPRPGSGAVRPPASRAESPAPADRDPLARHRARIMERLISKFASLRIYDVSKIDISELRKIVAAFISEYGDSEKIYLSDQDQGRLLLEILTSLQR